MGSERATAQVVAGAVNVCPTRAEAEAAVTTLLRFIGEDPDRPGLIETPARVVKAWMELSAGLERNAGRHLAKQFEVVTPRLVVMRGIRFASVCEHHFLPFIGEAVVGYLPVDRVVGFSKIPRVVLDLAKRPQVQERLTMQIADCLEAHIATRGVGVRIVARHNCMGCRGVEQPDAEAVTTELRGELASDPELRRQFLTDAGARG